jgi:hypothetical protein
VSERAPITRFLAPAPILESSFCLGAVHLSFPQTLLSNLSAKYGIPMIFPQYF